VAVPGKFRWPWQPAELPFRRDEPPGEPQEADGIREAEEALQRAQRLEQIARDRRRLQEHKRDQEREAVVARLDRLAGRDGDHLGRRVLEALTERHSEGRK
jgi:hypothetical protein